MEKILENKESKENKKIKIKKNDEEKRKELIKDNLKCSLSKKNYLDTKHIILGYPILGKNK